MPLKRVRIGSRSDNRVFNFGGSWSPDEIVRVSDKIRAVFTYFGSWTEAANQIADSLKDRVNPAPIPATLIRQADLLPSGWVNPLGLEDGLRQALSSINWASHADRQRLAQFKQQDLIKLQSAADQIARVDNRPAQTAIPTGGTLHEALRRYDEYAKEEQPLNHDRHAKIKQLIERSDDVPLAILDISACRNLIDYWRNRPPRHDGKGNYSAKRSREQLAELDLFFRHTHTNNDFAWRMPEDLQLLKRTISKDEKRIFHIFHKNCSQLQNSKNWCLQDQQFNAS